MFLKKHADKIVLGALAVALVATLWLGYEGLVGVRHLSRRVSIGAATLRINLASDVVGFDTQVSDRFEPGTVYSALQRNWEGGLPEEAYPAAILSPPPRR